MIAAAVTLAIVLAGVAARPSGARRAAAGTGPTSSSLSRVDAILRSWQRRRLLRRSAPAGAVADWCDGVERRVRSGASLRDALLSSSAADPATDRVLATVRLALERGCPIVEAVQRPDRPGPHLHLALSVIATASRVGGPSSAAIGRTAMGLRQRAADIEERSAHAAQARLSTHVMTAVPLVMLGVLTVTDGDVRDASSSGVGAACVGIGITLNVAGWWWMHRIVGATQ